MKCILSKFKSKFKEKSGDAGLVYGIFSVLGICMLTLIVMEFMRLTVTVRTVENALDHAALSAAADNAPAAYGGAREANSSIYDYTDASASVMQYVLLISSDDVEEKLEDEGGLSLSREGNSLCKRDGSDTLLFSISSLSVEGISPAADSDSGASSVFSVSCRLYIPLYFLQFDFGPTINVSVSSRYIPKF